MPFAQAAAQRTEAETALDAFQQQLGQLRQAEALRQELAQKAQ